MKMKLYKIRAALAIFAVKLIAKIFAIEIPPTVSVAAIIERDKKLLFVKLSYLDGYGLPGGLIKSGETLEEGLKREVYEETGLSVENANFYKSYPSQSLGLNTLSLVYIVKASGKIKSSDEGEVYWIEPKDILGKFAYKDTEKTINDYLKNK